MIKEIKIIKNIDKKYGQVQTTLANTLFKGKNNKSQKT